MPLIELQFTLTLSSPTRKLSSSGSAEGFSRFQLLIPDGAALVLA
jgi:hypothetical protein